MSRGNRIHVILFFIYLKVFCKLQFFVAIKSFGEDIRDVTLEGREFMNVA